jgi:hypothetical protein
LRKTFRSEGNGLSVRDPRGFGQKCRHLQLQLAFTSPLSIDEIANDSARVPPASGVVQEIVQCFVGRYWTPLPADRAGTEVDDLPRHRPPEGSELHQRWAATQSLMSLVEFR